MSRSISNRLKKLEDKLKINPKSRIALVTYNPRVCPQAEIPPIKANVVLYLPDNGHRIPHGKSMPLEGYLIKYL